MNKVIIAFVLAAAAGSGVAAAGGMPGRSASSTGPSEPSAASATTIDASLDGAISDKFAWSIENPNGGSTGTTTGFNDIFASVAGSVSTWALIGKDSSGLASGSQKIGNTMLSWGYNVEEQAKADPLDPSKTLPKNTAGTWWIKSSDTVVIDLALAVHASNSSGAWLFDNVQLGANDAQEGGFRINWSNNGGNVPAFSNITVFARDMVPVTSPVPEPQTYAMLLVALGVITIIKRRKQPV